MSETESSAVPLATVSVPRLAIVGAARGVGVSTITLGLLNALKKHQKHTIAVGKVGSFLIQNTHYRRITGLLSYSLHPWMLNRDQIRESVARLSSGAERVLIEADLPLYDYYPDDYGFGTEAELATFLEAPVILVVDAAGYGESIAAVVRGFVTLYEGVNVAGVICNNVKDPEQNERIKRAIEALHATFYLGGLPDSDVLTKEGENISDENPSLLKRSFVFAATELVEKHLNLDLIEKIFQQSGTFQVRKSILSSRSRACKIAVADDMAFHLTFQSNLDLLRREGAELVAFSPLVDRKLPTGVNGVYLPGGFVHLYAQDLSANAHMHRALQAFAESGGIVYAEGSAVGYLCKTVAITSSAKLTMAGLIPGHATLVDENRAGGAEMLVEVRSVEESAVTREGDRFRALRDYMWAIRLERSVTNCFELHPRNSVGAADDVAVIEGFAPQPNVLATSLQPHWASNPILARVFVDKASARKT